MSEQSKVAVVIPYYHSGLTDLEEIALRQCEKVLGQHPIVLLVKDGMPTEEYPKGEKWSYQTVPAAWMESIATYNRMMLSKEFYALFAEYEYILIYQLDAFVFSDRLLEFCNMGYDYIGAPWFWGEHYERDFCHNRWHVGNGGFSLRKVSAALKVLEKGLADTWERAEDFFWAVSDSEEFRVAPMEVASHFALEENARLLYLRNGKQLPFGCHAWNKLDSEFWKPFIEMAGYQLGTDIFGASDFRGARLKGLESARRNQWEDWISRACGKDTWDLYVFGAGQGGSACLELLRRVNIPLRCVDNNQARWGELLWDVPIESPAVLREGNPDNKIIFIFDGKWRQQITAQLEDMGFYFGEQFFLYREILKKVWRWLEQWFEDTSYREEKLWDLGRFHKKKLLIYGAEEAASRLAKALSDFQVVGVADPMHFGGERCGVPVLQWDEIPPKMADVVVVAGEEQDYYESYQRILDKCLAFGFEIYGENGSNLIEELGWKNIAAQDARYFRKTKEELKALIEKHDAVSFDLFDTLIMRKTLLPTDVFEMVGVELRKKGVDIPDFKVLRREAELQTPWGNIYDIYETLCEMTGCDREAVEMMVETELACEKKVLLPRHVMVELLRFAVNAGKRVSIISDMYLGAEILNDILQGMNIAGYDKIYVSCEHGVAKGSGLFERYLQDVPGMKCLHIGDNERADVKAPLQCGIASYGIKSAVEMLRVTNFRYVLPYFTTYNERSMLGLLLAELFNSPFALHGTAGILTLDNLAMVGKLFAAPVVAKYMVELYSYLQENDGFDKIIFGARDGYLFHRVYEQLKSTIWNEEKLPEAVYLAVSRKLCLRCAITEEKHLEVLARYVGDKNPAYVLTDMLGLPKEEVALYDEEKHNSIVDYFGLYMDAIRQKTLTTRGMYLKYLKSRGVNTDKQNLFFDLVSQGTVQYALNQMLEKPLQGFFVMDYGEKNLPEISVESIYENLKSPILTCHNFLEIIFSAKEASVCDMGVDFNLVYEQEKRGAKQIVAMEEMQKGIEAFFEDYFVNLYLEGSAIKKEMPEHLLAMYSETEYIGNASILKEIRLFDELSGDFFEIIPE